MSATEDHSREASTNRDDARAQLLEERRALLQQLRGYELVMNGLRMRARQLERVLEEPSTRQ